MFEKKNNEKSNFFTFEKWFFHFFHFHFRFWKVIFSLFSFSLSLLKSDFFTFFTFFFTFEKWFFHFLHFSRKSLKVKKVKSASEKRKWLFFAFQCIYIPLFHLYFFALFFFSSIYIIYIYLQRDTINSYTPEITPFYLSST